MRRRHFDALRPICPTCRTSEGSFPLEVASVERELDGDILLGILHCGNAHCQREYPILDGIPILVPRLREYVEQNALQLLTRDDLTPAVESLIGDACGPSSPFDTVRQWLSSYGWDHYAEFDPDEPPGEPRPGSLLRLLERGWEMMGEIPSGPILDVGCSVGRGTFALAEREDRLVLGVDLNVAMLRTASRALRTGVASYPRRRGGVVYDQRKFAIFFSKSANVDFWTFDAAAPPFAERTFAAAVGLNVLDSAASPVDLLMSLGRLLVPGGRALLTCPYDWSSAATPFEAWLGGHSQRGPHRGDGVAWLRELLGPEAPLGLRLVAEADDLPWYVRLHDRSGVAYRVHAAVAQAEPFPSDGRVAPAPPTT